MNEITRIHLAKVPYNIEIGAKKELEKYLAAIKEYADDDELLLDVEVRIIELLNERKVKKSGTITIADIKAIREQLGKPEDFSSEDVSAGSDDKPTHRLYRDTAHAWLGGVAAGIARYFGIQAWWIRLGFIVLTALTSGAAIPLYLVLWLVIPPTKTASDVLQLEGKPATVATIHHLSEQDDLVNITRDRKITRFASIVLGISVSLFGVGLVVMLSVSPLLIGSAGIHNFPVEFAAHLGVDTSVSWLLASMITFGLVLLLVLLGLAVYLLFTWRWTKRLWMSGIIVLALGIATVGTVITISVIGARNVEDTVTRLTKTHIVYLPDDFTNVKDLTFSGSTDSVTYVVDGGKPRIEITALPGEKSPRVSVNNQRATLTADDNNGHYLNYYSSPTVTIYGPALNSITTKKGNLDYELATHHLDALSVHVEDGSSFSVAGGTIDSLTTTLDESTTLDATGAAVRNVIANQAAGAALTLANISSLNLTAPDVCANNGEDTATQVQIASIAGAFTLNQKQLVTKTYSNACVAITIGAEY